ncbi:MAG: putative ABC transporter permease [Spirochaetota bacterium]
MEHIAYFGTLFALGAVAGWCIELLYRRAFSHKAWINPGFLEGPYLPLYGVGILSFFLISQLQIPFWGKFILFALVPTVFELVTGVLFYTWYQIRLWDYSDRWANVKGFICPQFTLFWMVLGAVYYYLIHPACLQLLTSIGQQEGPLFYIGMFYGIFLVDVLVSFQAASRIKRLLSEAEEKVHVNYERLKLETRIWMREYAPRVRRLSYLFPFEGHGRVELKRVIAQELQKLREGSKVSSSVFDVKAFMKRRNRDE